MSGHFLICETNNGPMDIYVSSNETKSKLPVVIVLQEAFGVNHHIRSICDRLSNEGFLAVAPELYHRFGRRIEIPYENRKDYLVLLEKLSNDQIMNDIKDTLNFLRNLPTADTDIIHTLGFCMGGFSSALCATELNITKVVSFYGAGMVRAREGVGLSPFSKQMGQIKSKCLFFFGGKDASIPESDINEIRKELTMGHVSFEIKIFENSDHGFFCDERKVFNREDARTAWEKTLKFLSSP